jgi:site-specific DNA-methyltransferase (adenine-specific)
LKWGTGGIDIDGCRVATNDDTTRKQTTNTPKFSGKYNNGKDYHTPIGTLNGGNEQGRFPANLIHDGSDEVLSLFPNSKSSNSVRKNNKGWGDGIKYGKGNAQDSFGFNDSGSASRFFYCAKASKQERNEGVETNGHPTVKPILLMQYLVKLVSRENATVLDPFMGSGTTGIACKNLSRKFVGIERDAQYFEIATKRINKTNKLF